MPIYRLLLSFMMVIPIHTLEGMGQSMADRWKFIGIAVEEEGYHIWGSSPIKGPDGRVHLFLARWPSGYQVDPGWRSHSEIAHYVSDIPEGPFEFVEVVLTGTGKETWDRYGVHNPAVHKVGEQYVLLYISNNNPQQPPHPSNQCIGMLLSESLYGPWRKAGTNGRILIPPEDPRFWNHGASNGVNNPALLPYPGGGFYLYFKSEKARMGLAIAEKLEGPYVQLPFPITSNEHRIEDGYAFIMDGRVCLLTTDNEGIIERGGGLLWTSDDGIHFGEPAPGFHTIQRYIDRERLSKAKHHYGGRMMKFERPQVLMIEGKPSYLYAPSGYHIKGGESTVCYVLKYNDK